jgi:hypothetical protein
MKDEEKQKGVLIDSGNPDFDALLKQMADTCKRKNHDYSDPESADYYKNFRSCESFGVPAELGIMVRMSDKWSRICELSKKEAQVKDETVEDTLIDLSVYSLFSVLVRRAKKEKGDPGFVRRI